MKYLITGGAGFIGSNLAKELSKQNKITIVDNLSTGFKEHLQRIEMLNLLDVTCNKNKLIKIFKGHEIIFI